LLNIYFYIYATSLLLYTTSSPLSLWEYLCYGGKNGCIIFLRGHVNHCSFTDIIEYKRRQEFSRKGLNPLNYIKYPQKILFNSIYAYYTILLSIQVTADVLKTAFLTPQLLLVVYAWVRACASTILVGRCTI